MRSLLGDGLARESKTTLQSKSSEFAKPAEASRMLITGGALPLAAWNEIIPGKRLSMSDTVIGPASCHVIGKLADADPPALGLAVQLYVDPWACLQGGAYRRNIESALAQPQYRQRFESVHCSLNETNCFLTLLSSQRGNN